MSIKVTYERFFWECECCGCGFHSRLTVGDKVYSHNDQFGGALGENEVDLGYDADESVKAILAELKESGIDYEYEEHLGSYEPTEWSDYDD